MWLEATEFDWPRWRHHWVHLACLGKILQNDYVRLINSINIRCSCDITKHCKPSYKIPNNLIILLIIKWIPVPAVEPLSKPWKDKFKIGTNGNEN